MHLILLVHAQVPSEATQASVIPWVGMVQFVSGDVKKADDQTVLQHTDPIYAGDVIRIGIKGLVKVYTKGDCIIALHGPGRLSFDSVLNEFVLQTFRGEVICKYTGGSTQFRIMGNSFKMESPSNALFQVAGKSEFNLGLIGRRFLTPEKVEPKVVTRFTSDQKIFESDMKLEDLASKMKRPKEALPLPPAKVVREIKNRVTLGPHFGRSSLIFDRRSQDESNLKLDGAELLYERKLLSGRSLRLSFSFLETESKNNVSSGPRPPGVYNRVSGESIAVGLGTQFDKWYKLYGSAILAHQVLKQDISQNTSYANTQNEFYLVGINIGGEILLQTQRDVWYRYFGLYARSEISALTSVHRGFRTRENQNSSPTESPPSDPNWMNQLSALISAGVLVQF